MLRTAPRFRSVFLASLLIGPMGLMGLTGCPDNPYKVETWTKDLTDKHKSEIAITKLEELGDPKAIPALGKAWDRQNRPPRIMNTIIDLARPVTEAEAVCPTPGKEETKNGRCLTGFPKGRPASWSAALPFLKQALSEVDVLNPRAVDSAIKAADALGECQTPEAMQVLIDASANPELNTPKAQRVRLASIVAVGKYTDPAAVTALSTMLKTSIEDHSSAMDALKKALATQNEAEAKGARERATDSVTTAGAAVTAMADLGSASAVKVLIETMYRVPPLAEQVRRALVSSGPGVGPELRKVLRGEHAEVNALFKDKKLDSYCGDRGNLPPDQCLPVSARDFYAALILGDLYDAAAVPDLLRVLANPPLPVYYADDAPSPNSQHNAVFDALRKIGAAEGADRVKAFWVDPKNDVRIRAMATSAYGFVARNDSSTRELAAIAEDNAADSSLRMEAATTYARIADDLGSAAMLTRQAQLYAEASEKRKAEVAKARPAYDKIKTEFDEAKKRYDDARAAATKASNDKTLPVEQIVAATKEAEKVKTEFEAVKVKFKAAGDQFKPLERAVDDYKAYQRGFQTHIARIEIAQRCKGKADCFAAAFTAKVDEVVAKVAPHIKDIKDWTDDEKKGLVVAQIERAGLELGKLGSKASSAVAALLAAAGSTDRITRQSALLALPKVAPKPCADCVAKLDEAIKAGAGQVTLAELNAETAILRNYFRAQGGGAAEKSQ